MFSDQDILWKFFLSLREEIIVEKDHVSELVVLISENHFSIKLHHSPEENEDNYIHIILSGSKPVITGDKVCVVFIDEFNFVQVYHNNLLDDELLKMLRLYLPLCLNPQISRKNEKSFAIAHFAQSLDGKIATNTGNSRWISGEENLIHAHRMRALCGGILIGMNTLLRDRPALTVRLVEGENPVKIVLGNSSADFSSLDASGDKVVVITNVTLNLPGHIKLIKLSKDKDFLDPHEILKVIYKELKNKGVNQRIINNALNQYLSSQEELEMAQYLMDKWLRRRTEEDSSSYKLKNYLANKGFNYDLIYQVTDK